MLLYFILSEDDFEIKSKYFIIVLSNVLPTVALILSFQDDILQNTFYLKM